MGGAWYSSPIFCVSWYPVHNIVALINYIADPMEYCVHCFGPFLFDIIVCGSSCTKIVDLDWCIRLRMAHFMQCHSRWCCFLAIVKTASILWFWYWGHHIIYDFTLWVDWAIWLKLFWWFFGLQLFIAEEEMTTCSVSCFWSFYVASIWVNIQYHVAGMILYSCFRVRDVVI